MRPNLRRQVPAKTYKRKIDAEKRAKHLRSLGLTPVVEPWGDKWIVSPVFTLQNKRTVPVKTKGF